MHRQPRMIGRATQLVADMVPPSLSLLANNSIFVHGVDPVIIRGPLGILGSGTETRFGLLGGRFARFDLDLFALIPDSLAFVGLGFAECSHLGGELSD